MATPNRLGSETLPTNKGHRSDGNGLARQFTLLGKDVQPEVGMRVYSNGRSKETQVTARCEISRLVSDGICLGFLGPQFLVPTALGSACRISVSESNDWRLQVPPRLMAEPSALGTVRQVLPSVLGSKCEVDWDCEVTTREDTGFCDNYTLVLLVTPPPTARQSPRSPRRRAPLTPRRIAEKAAVKLKVAY